MKGLFRAAVAYTIAVALGLGASLASDWWRLGKPGFFGGKVVDWGTFFLLGLLFSLPALVVVAACSLLTRRFMQHAPRTLLVILLSVVAFVSYSLLLWPEVKGGWFDYRVWGPLMVFSGVLGFGWVAFVQSNNALGAR